MPGHNNWISTIENDTNIAISFDFKDMQSMNKEESIINNVEKICLDHGDDIYIALSGGMDSEFVANSFKKAGKSFKVVLVDYLTNRAELWYAKRWCYLNNVTPDIISLSVGDMETKLIDICNTYGCSYISALDFMLKEYVEERGGKFITGGPEPFNRVDCFADNFTQTISENLENLTVYFKFCQLTNNSHPYKFLMYTPEMLYNIVKEMGYGKPIQLAMSEYYGIESRPKIPYSHLWPLLLPKMKELAIETNKKSYYRKVDLGTKEQMLTAGDTKQIHTVLA